MSNLRDQYGPDGCAQRPPWQAPSDVEILRCDDHGRGCWSVINSRTGEVLSVRRNYEAAERAAADRACERAYEGDRS